MGTQIQDAAVIRGETDLSYPLLGATAMVGAPMLLITIVLDRLGHLPGGMMGRTDGLLSIVYCVGWLCSAVAMRQLRVFGSGKVAAAVSVVQIVGLILAGIWAVLVAVHPHSSGSLVFRITDPAWPLSHAYMLLLGGAAIRANRWSGWRKYAPLACGLAIPFALAAVLLGGRPAMEMEFAVHTALAWSALGWAVFTSGTAGSHTAHAPFHATTAN